MNEPINMVYGTGNDARRIAELEAQIAEQELAGRVLLVKYRELEAAAKAFVMAPGWDNEDELSALEATLEGGE